MLLAWLTIAWPPVAYTFHSHPPQIRDVRRVHPADPQRRSAYPLRLLDKAARMRRCDLCAHSTAQRVTYSDPLAPTNPCFYCRDCFGMLHVDAGGKRLRPEVMVYDYNGGGAPV